MAIFITSASRICSFRIVVSAKEHDDSLLLNAALFKTLCLIASERAVRAAQVLFGLTCVVYGLAHFAYADFTAIMVPMWLPSRLGFAYFTWLGHVAAGIGIMIGILPRLAATLEALMMSLFGLLVWVPSLFMQPPPEWATPPRNQWSELFVTLLLAASAWIVATSLQNRPWGFASRSRTHRDASDLL